MLVLSIFPCILGIVLYSFYFPITTNIIDTIILVESKGKYNAISSNGAIGLMQITRSALIDYNAQHKDNWCLKDMKDPIKNRIVGTWYYSIRVPQIFKCFDIQDTIKNRLIAYNAGCLVAIRYARGSNFLPVQTHIYLKKIKDIEHRSGRPINI